MNAAVVQDHVSFARWVVGNDVFKELNRLIRTLSIKFPMDEVAFADIQISDGTLLLLGARCRNLRSVAELHIHSPYGRQGIEVVFILE